MDSAFQSGMQPTHDSNSGSEPPRSGQGVGPSEPAAPRQPGQPAPGQTVIREKSDDPAVIITRTGASYNTRVMTAAVVALALLFVAYVVIHRHNAPGSDVSASNGGEVAVDSSPIPGRTAPAESGSAATPYWPAIPYANGQPSQTVITPSPYTTTPMTPMPMYGEPSVPPASVPSSVPVGPPPAPVPTTPRNASPPATSSGTTVFPRLDSILGVPTDSQGRARVPVRHDTVTHIDSVLHPPATQPKPAVVPPAAPTRVDTTQHSAAPPPVGATTRADTSAARS